MQCCGVECDARCKYDVYGSQGVSVTPVYCPFGRAGFFGSRSVPAVAHTYQDLPSVCYGHRLCLAHRSQPSGDLSLL